MTSQILNTFDLLVGGSAVTSLFAGSYVSANTNTISEKAHRFYNLAIDL